MEAARDLGATLEAAIPVHAIAADRVPVADDERRAAARTPGRLALGIVDVTDVAEPDATLARDQPCPRERARRGARAVGHLEVGMEGGEVQRHVGPEML